MTRYFFDTRENGKVVADVDGVECPDLDCAKREAVAALADLAKDVLPKSFRRELTISVRDMCGRKHFSASLTFETKDGG